MTDERLGIWPLQVANSFAQGADKFNFEGRRQFARDNLENIRDSAADPLGGRRYDYLLCDLGQQSFRRAYVAMT